MRTQYGYRRPDGSESWLDGSRESVEDIARANCYTLLAREVSAARVVSIRN